MARYQYTGPGPVMADGVQITGSSILRPGDICEFDEEPAFGPWELLDGPDTPAPEPPASAPAPFLPVPPAPVEGM